MKVDRRRLQATLVVWVDADAARLHGGANVAVGEDGHGRIINYDPGP
jgi:hypothetical protein